MITLPSSPSPTAVSPRLLDYGITMRSALGGAATRIDRAGSRFAVDVQYPFMTADTARVFVSRLIAAKSEGVRIPFPLLGVSQGSPGSPVVDGAGQSGTSLAVRGFTASYTASEGFWLSIEDASGQHYLHNVRADATADGLGDATLTIAPALRTSFADGATIHMATPMVEGFVDGDAWDWELPTNKLIAVHFTIEESA